uniref:tRNA wybutosine-synthesizing protein 3 homolog n=1 Tax=Salarias fasciatus TaxID=181472 RepID=A0A672HRI9_SALFA
VDISKKFVLWKKQCVEKLDASKKGSVDENIQHVVTLLNSCEQFFTTSSCSGRIILIDGVPGSAGVQKQNCGWLLVCHSSAACCVSLSGDALLKFEPFVLHVQCRKLEDAQLVVSMTLKLRSYTLEHTHTHTHTHINYPTDNSSVRLLFVKAFLMH